MVGYIHETKSLHPHRAPRPPNSSFHIGGRPNSELVGKNHKEEEDVEIDPRDFSPDDREPEFKNKVEEDIWRLKNKK